MEAKHSSQKRYSPEVRERAVRMFGMTPETLRAWVRRGQVDQRVRLGLTTDERQRLKDLEKENRELRRASEILKDASILFATELDGRPQDAASSRLGRRRFDIRQLT
jgi:transposase